MSTPKKDRAAAREDFAYEQTRRLLHTGVHVVEGKPWTVRVQYLTKADLPRVIAAILGATGRRPDVED
jgi:hypothetical protein